MQARNHRIQNCSGDWASAATRGEDGIGEDACGHRPGSAEAVAEPAEEQPACRRPEQERTLKPGKPAAYQRPPVSKLLAVFLGKGIRRVIAQGEEAGTFQSRRSESRRSMAAGWAVSWVIGM